MTTFQEIGLNPKILSALESKGYTTPTPIQLQAIPHSLAGKDVLGIAQTGTGKTAAFSLPIIHNLAQNSGSVGNGSIRALILTPTRELASQIADQIELYGKDLNLRHAVIFGGVSERPQIAELQRGVDILIATPGRLLDLATQGYIRFMKLEIFVLDEADRMLDMGFINDIKKIIARIPDRKQTLFFSATMPTAINDLANSILKDPIKVEVTPQSTTVERIAQKVMFVEKSNKSALLKRIIKEEEIQSVLVFCKTKHGSDRIQEFLLRNSIKVVAIHGNKSQGAREKALEAFRNGSAQVMIATDIAARGIDIPAISHVINYDIPMDPESYVHRIGRTARAGREGIAISFCDSSETKLLQAVEKTINYKIPVDETHPFHGVAAAPTSRESKRDDREFSEERGRRNFGHSQNREKGDRPERNGRSNNRSSQSEDRRGEERRSRSSQGEDRRGNERRGEERQGDDRRRDPKNNDRRSNNRDNRRPRDKQDGSKTGLLDFIGFGRKKTDNKSRRENRPHITKNGDFLSINEKKENKFGFSWFRNKKDEDFSIGSESRSDNFRSGGRSSQGERGNRRSDNNQNRSSGNNRSQARSGDNRSQSRSGGNGRSEGRSEGRFDGRSSGTTSRGNSSRSNDGNRGGNFRKW